MDRDVGAYLLISDIRVANVNLAVLINTVHVNYNGFLNFLYFSKGLLPCRFTFLFYQIKLIFPIERFKNRV